MLLRQVLAGPASREYELSSAEESHFHNDEVQQSILDLVQVHDMLQLTTGTHSDQRRA